MGEFNQYHIKMLVFVEQERAIRLLFKDKNWPCWIKAVSDENVVDIIQSGFTDVFTVLTAGQHGNHGDTVFEEFKSENINVKAEINISGAGSNLETSSEEQEHSDNKSYVFDSEHNISDNKSRIPDNEQQVSDKESPVLSDNSNKSSANIKQKSDNGDKSSDNIQQESDNGDKSSDNIQQESDNSNKSSGNIQEESDNINKSSGNIQEESDNSNKSSGNIQEESDNNNKSSDNMQEESDNVDTDCDYMNSDKDLNSSSSDTVEESPEMLRSKSCNRKKNINHTQCCDKIKSSKKSNEHQLPSVTSGKSRSSRGSDEVKKTKFRCTLCDTYLASKPSLLRHCQRRHRDEWFEFKCKDCPCMFKKLEELWKHRNEVKHKPPKVQPKFSEKKNLSPEELEQLGHIKCNACGKILPSRRLLRRHFYSDHRECMPGPLCAVCGAEFKTRQELWKHKREMKHNDSLSLLQTYQCEECGKILTGGYHSFKLHQKYACKETEEEPQTECDICGGMFKSETHVQQHKKRTHVDLPVVCDICGTMCKNKHALNSHKRRHNEKNKKYVCDNCGKAFLSNILLKMHIRTHTKEKPYKCPMCDYRCAIKQNIQKHSVNVHKTQVKCADIVTISETGLSASSTKTPLFENGERGYDETLHAKGRSSQFPAESGLLPDKMELISNERMSHLNKVSNNLNNMETRMSNDRTLLTNDRSLLTNDRSLPTNNRALFTNDMAWLTNDRTLLSNNRPLLTTNNRPLLTNNRSLLTNNRSLMINNRTLLTSDSTKGWKSLSSDGSLISEEKRSNLNDKNFKGYLNNRDKNYLLTDMEGAYDLTMYRQNVAACSRNEVDKVTVNTENSPANLNSVNVTSDSFSELMNCSINPLTYTHADTSPRYPYTWEQD